MEKIVILDANSLLYRFFYALPFFSSHQSIPTNALYGLTNALIKIINEEKPDYFIACFDSRVKTFRHLKDVQYKSQRVKISDDLKIQINLAPKIFKAFNVITLEKINYEADDLIGSLVKKNPDKFKVIFSGDLDLLQILDNLTILKFFKKGVSEVEIYDVEKVKEKLNILPSQLADFKALIGDSSDNIIGIKGIGKKTAAELLNRFKTVEEIIIAAQKKLIPFSLRNLILNNQQRLILNKELATIITDLELNFNLEKYKGVNLNELIEILKEFDFYSIIERLKKNNNFLPTSSLPIRFNNYLPKFLERVYCLINEDKIYIFDEKNFYCFDLESSIFKKISEAKEIIIFDLKNFFKKYFQLEKKFISLDKFFDIKTAFWLTKNVIKPTVEKIISFYTKKFSAGNLIESFLKLMPQIYEDLSKRIDEYQLNNIFVLDQKISIILALVELNGLKIDLSNLKKIKENLLSENNKLKEEVFQIVGERFNLNSTNELREIILNKLKINPNKLKKTPKGFISVGESELIKIKNTHPVIEKILLYRQKEKLFSNFIKNLLKYSQNGLIFPNFEITGSITGRIISFMPNLQNLPPETKTIFIPQNNNILVSYDYSQIELRILAHFSQDESLINIFYQDLDIHSITAKLLFKKENEETRKLAKIINYGIVYGITPQGIAQRTGLNLKRAQEIINDYFKNFPGIKKFINELISKFQAYGYTETLFGRKRFFLEIDSPKSYRLAINTPIQGTAADILKLAIVDIFDYLLSQNLLSEIRLLLIIHDELIFEMSKKNFPIFKEKIKHLMENVVNLTVPLKVKIKSGYNLRDLQ